ncbi:uncharacterized protein SCHCODRAFT_02512695 [Schizophyllum commune H4-8]|nr:uncharacterized protein SCHCODRAFT_02512695 [Schizophyllum commune H4-8]KAI5888891.1 hypothetical protein SCHCODRAFT_02512695 [Schizophyllum commune H4-8]
MNEDIQDADTSLAGMIGRAKAAARELMTFLTPQTEGSHTSYAVLSRVAESLEECEREAANINENPRFMQATAWDLADDIDALRDQLLTMGRRLQLPGLEEPAIERTFLAPCSKSMESALEKMENLAAKTSELRAALHASYEREDELRASVCAHRRENVGLEASQLAAQGIASRLQRQAESVDEAKRKLQQTIDEQQRHLVCVTEEKEAIVRDGQQTSETQDLEAKTRDCRQSHALERAQLQGELEQAREVLNDIRNVPQDLTELQREAAATHAEVERLMNQLTELTDYNLALERRLSSLNTPRGEMLDDSGRDLRATEHTRGSPMELAQTEEALASAFGSGEFDVSPRSQASAASTTEGKGPGRSPTSYDQRRSARRRLSPYSRPSNGPGSSDDSDDGQTESLPPASPTPMHRSKRSGPATGRFHVGLEGDGNAKSSPFLRKQARQRLIPGLPFSFEEVNTNLNRLVTMVFKKAFKVRFLNAIRELPGVSDERLSLFESNPARYGPDVHNLQLDTTFRASTTLMKNSPWNMLATQRLVDLVFDTISNDTTGCYGSADVDLVSQKVEDRLGRQYRGIAEATPIGDETWDEVVERCLDNHTNYNKHCRSVMARNYIASIMREKAEMSGADEQLDHWSYVLRSLEQLNYEGMSDEESDTEEVVFPGGVVAEQPCRRVLEMRWRHPSFKEVFDDVDQTPAQFPDIFNKLALKNRIRRVRVAQTSERAPPKKLSIALFDPSYLEEIGPAGIIALGINEDDDTRTDEEGQGQEDEGEEDYDWD